MVQEVSADISYEGKLPYIFISCPAYEKERIYLIANTLSNIGYRIYLGIERMEGQNKLAEKIKSCHCFIACFTSNTVNDNSIKQEISYAADNNRSILCINSEDNINLDPGLKLQMGSAKLINSNGLNENQLIDELCKFLPENTRGMPHFSDLITSYKKPIMSIVFLCLFATFFLVGRYVYINFLYEKVPDLVGYSQEHGEDLLSKMDIKVMEEEVFDDFIPVGQIISQSIAEGEKIRKGGKITVSISKGADALTLSDNLCLALIDAGVDLNGNGKISSKELDKVTKLDLDGENLSSVKGLEYAKNLTELVVSNNSLNDISSLAGLDGLIYLDISHNNISELIAITGFQKLETLIVNDNKLTEIDDVASLPSIKNVVLDNNLITDIVSLTDVEISRISLKNNKLDLDKTSLDYQVIKKWKSKGYSVIY